MIKKVFFVVASVMMIIVVAVIVIHNHISSDSSREKDPMSITFRNVILQFSFKMSYLGKN
jgi:hypothetical protein